MKWERRLWAVIRNISEKLRTPGASAISRINAECVTTGKEEYALWTMAYASGGDQAKSHFELSLKRMRCFACS